MNFSENPGGDEEITMELTPLIDMVFQLLVFFLLTTTFAANVEQGSLELDLPRAKSSQVSAMANKVVIAVLQDGRMVMGGETLNHMQLEDELNRVKSQSPSTMVLVQADRVVPHWRVVEVMDIAASIGLNRLAIATAEN